jgi:hypothetical protein
MKKIIFTGLGMTLPMLAISLISYGQTTHTGLRFTENTTPAETSVSKASVGALSRSDVKSKAAKDFASTYKGISSENWFEEPNGFLAMFTSKDVRYRLDYDKKGNWLCTIRTYDESELPADLRRLVKSSYYDYNIIGVNEIEMPRDNFTYIVYLVGKTNLINLRIHDGEMEEWQKFVKSE